ncbi:MAG TPA: hypothetical protein PLL51_01490 [Bacteroidales bacterium]|nr:hypothetical protein [Bacteroidales bacterium]
MDKERTIRGIEILVSSALFLIIIYALYLRFLPDEETFQQLVREDGFVEYTTVVFLLFACIICIWRAFSYRSVKNNLGVLTWALLAFLFFFAAGDEISWGQRIFGIESSEFFLKHNKQAETNLHNLVIGGHSVNKIIFSRLLFLVLSIYFLFWKPLVLKVPAIRKLNDKFCVPLPRLHHIIVIVAVTLMILLIGMYPDSELHELSFAMIFFLIFLNPAKLPGEESQHGAVDS